MSAAYSRTWWAAVLSIGAAGIALTVAAGPAEADDFQFRQDKQIHFAGSIGMGALANLVTDDPWKAFGGCAAVGAAAEIVPKFTGHGVSSFHDLAYDVAGCALGAYAGFKVKGLLITPNAVIYRKEF